MSARADEVLTTDAAAVAHPARSAARRPPYAGYVGAAAVGLRDHGLPGRDDVLDLGEAELYRNPWSPADMVLRGSALALFIACTGATVEEIPKITYDPERPLRDWIDLPGDDLVAARTVPLPELAAIALRIYRKLADKITKCDRLFVDCDGRPLTTNAIRAQFNRVGQRIGIAGARVPTSLRQAYIAWLDASPDTATAAYLRGYNFGLCGRPDQDPTPSAKRALVATYHPLGKLDREMLRWRGPVARRDAARPMRELSADTRKARTAAKRQRAAYPKELKEAVRDAIASGHEPKAVFDNYGVSFRVLFDYVPRPKRDPLAAQKDAIRAKFEGPRAPSCKALRAWLAAEHGIVVSLWKLRQRLKDWGILHLVGRESSKLVDPYLNEIRATIPEGGVADLKLIVRLLAEKGVTIGIGGLRASLHARDVPLPTVPTVAFSSDVEVDVRAWISIYPPPSLKTLSKRLENVHGVHMSPYKVSARVKAMGIGKARAPRASSAVAAVGPHLSAIKAYVIAQPTATWATVADWAVAELGLAIKERCLIRCMHRLGVNKMALAASARKSPHVPDKDADDAAKRVPEQPACAD